MKKMDKAIDRIRRLECPTADVENNLALILEDYEVADRDKIIIDRDNTLDRGEARAYRVEIEGQGQPIIVLAKSGYDDYVAKVVEVYSKS